MRAELAKPTMTRQLDGPTLEILRLLTERGFIVSLERVGDLFLATARGAEEPLSIASGTEPFTAASRLAETVRIPIPAVQDCPPPEEGSDGRSPDSLGGVL